ncbi:ABC transporter ATP-binding protein [Acinetobacter pittii]|uniref:ABC transporter ATP-binding protein n=1 Tax=Acinetobacter pittii TaxID=48296 RepID=UPI002E18ABE3|nr:ABC transporter ATP-binding protein [Acinetobacter pittii]
MLKLFLEMFKDMNKVNKNIKYKILFTLLIILLVTLLGVYLPIVMKNLINSSQAGVTYIYSGELFSLSNIAYIAIIYACVWVFLHILSWVKNIFNSMILIDVLSSLLSDGISNYLNLKSDEQKKIETGVFHTDLLRGSDSFGQILSIFLFILLPSILQVVMIVYVLNINFGYEIGILFLISTILVFLLCIFFSYKTKDIFTSFYEAKNYVNNKIIEKIQNSYDIKINFSKDYEIERLNKDIKYLSQENFESNYKLSLYMMLNVIFIGIFLVLFLLIFVNLFEHNKITSGDFVLIGTYIVELTAPFLMISQNLLQMKGHLISVKRFFGYKELQSDVYKDDKFVIKDTNSFFNFDNATLKLGSNIVDNFSLRVEKNKCYIIIGQTGSGKTTLINYLIGLNKVEKGKLYYKDIDITKNFPVQIFDEIAVVQQRPVLYSGTLRENLILNSKYKYTDDELLSLLRIFKLENLLNSNNIDLDSDLVGLYKSFSGGEMQRICLIRALLKQPQLLIMDEPTSALDENISLEMINYIKNRVGTLVLITHSDSLHKFSDEILNIDELINSLKKS